MTMNSRGSKESKCEQCGSSIDLFWTTGKTNEQNTFYIMANALTNKTVNYTKIYNNFPKIDEIEVLGDSKTYYVEF